MNARRRGRDDDSIEKASKKTKNARKEWNRRRRKAKKRAIAPATRTVESPSRGDWAMSECDERVVVVSSSGGRVPEVGGGGVGTVVRSPRPIFKWAMKAYHEWRKSWTPDSKSSF